MASNLDVVCTQRLNNIMQVDKGQLPAKLNKVLKSEVARVIKNYMGINDEDFDVNIDLNNSGYFELNIHVLSKRIIMANSFCDF